MSILVSLFSLLPMDMERAKGNFLPSTFISIFIQGVKLDYKRCVSQKQPKLLSTFVLFFTWAPVLLLTLELSDSDFLPSTSPSYIQATKLDNKRCVSPELPFCCWLWSCPTVICFRGSKGSTTICSVPLISALKQKYFKLKRCLISFGFTYWLCKGWWCIHRYFRLGIDNLHLQKGHPPPPPSESCKISMITTSW